MFFVSIKRSLLQSHIASIGPRLSNHASQVLGFFSWTHTYSGHKMNQMHT